MIFDKDFILPLSMESCSPEDTRSLGTLMGERAQAGDVIALTGDLGAGKTLFAGGFARGLGIDEAVCSPTFTIVQEYYEGRLPLYHFDVYRIDDPDEMEETGTMDYIGGEGVCLLEWADLIPELLPEDTVYVNINRDPSRGDDFRKIEIRRGGETC